MNALFLHVFNIAVTAGWIVLACLLIRWCLRRRLSAWVRVALWGVVGARLLFPFSLESALSLIPSAETVPSTITTAPAPTVNVGVPVVDQVLNPVISQTMAPVPEASVNPMQVVVAIGATVWLLGIAVILTAWLVQMIHLRREVRINKPVEQGVYACDGLPTAFVLGVLRPKIYIPSGLDPQDREYVLAHERMHIRRGDHVFRILGILLLTVYWFHPLLWVAYILYCRDVEVACDEAVLNKLGEAHARRYALALVNCAANRARVHKYRPLSFGERNITERVKHMMIYKKPKLWMTVIAVALIAATTVCFLTNPVSAKEPDEPITSPNTQETTGTEQSTEPPTEQPTEEVTTTPEVVVVPSIVPPGGLLSKELEAEISKAYQKQFGVAWKWYYTEYELDNGTLVCDTSYYGIYGDCVVLYSPATACVLGGIEIGGYIFLDSTPPILEVYRNGKICYLYEAYDAGWITDDQLREIWIYHYSTKGIEIQENPSTEGFHMIKYG